MHPHKDPLQSEDQALQQTLQKHQVAPASAALRARILAQAAAMDSLPSAQTLPPARLGAWWELLAAMGGWKVAVPAMALSLALGVVWNLSPAQPTDEIAAVDTATTLWELAGLAETLAEDRP